MASPASASTASVRAAASRRSDEPECESGRLDMGKERGVSLASSLNATRSRRHPLT